MDMDVFLVLGEVPLKLSRKNHQSKQKSKFIISLSTKTTGFGFSSPSLLCLDPTKDDA